ncbi:hypothetical protein D3C87_1822070 [compost metagenome]
MADHSDVRVHRLEACLGLPDLGPPHVVGSEEDLALQVRARDLVEVHQRDRPDPCGRQVSRKRRAQASDADHRDLGVLETTLPRDADLGQGQVAAVSFLLRDAQRLGGRGLIAGMHGQGLLDRVG